MKRTYVLDTNVFLTNARSVFEFKNNDIIIPLKVLDEIDKHKKRQDGVGLNARSIIRILDDFRSKGNLHKGIRMGKGLGILSVRGYDVEDIPTGCDLESADNEIIGTAITEKKRLGKRKVIVVTRDINMRVKCASLGIPTEDYVPNKIVTNTNELYTGFKKHLEDEEIVNRFYSGEDIFLEKEEIRLNFNEFVMLVSNSNDKKTGLARFIGYNMPLKKVEEDAVPLPSLAVATVPDARLLALLGSDASFESAIAAEALMSALTIAPDETNVTLESGIVTVRVLPEVIPDASKAICFVLSELS